jgi:hypothetical protein
MKINWGTGIVIAIVLFIAFILYFVIKVQTDSKYDYELVVEEYYKQELGFQEELNKQQNAIDLEVALEINIGTHDIEIKFPKDFLPNNIEGKVSLYRPSNRKLDFEIPISLSDSYLLIPKSSLVGGRWDISIDWKYQGKNFLNKKVLYLN